MKYRDLPGPGWSPALDNYQERAEAAKQEARDRGMQEDCDECGEALLLDADIGEFVRPDGEHVVIHVSCRREGWEIA
jgi:hypothetical protein